MARRCCLRRCPLLGAQRQGVGARHVVILILHVLYGREQGDDDILDVVDVLEAIPVEEGNVHEEGPVARLRRLAAAVDPGDLACAISPTRARVRHPFAHASQRRALQRAQRVRATHHSLAIARADPLHYEPLHYALRGANRRCSAAPPPKLPGFMHISPALNLDLEFSGTFPLHAQTQGFEKAIPEGSRERKPLGREKRPIENPWVMKSGTPGSGGAETRVGSPKPQGREGRK